MIRPGAGGGRHALERVETIHPVGGLGPPPGAVVARVAQGARAAAEEIGVERDDDVGAIEVVLDLDVFAERELPAGADVLAAGRIPLVPSGGREAREEGADLGRQCRRAHRLGQDPQTGALKGLLRRERRPDRPEKRRPRPNLADVGERLRAIGIVEAEHRGLGKDIGCAEAAGMKGVALNLGRASLVAFDEQSRRDAAERHRGRIEERHARHELFGLADEGHDLLRRLPRACGHSRQRHRGTHQLQERPARHRIGDRFHLRRELVVQVLAERRIVGSLFEGSPK